MRDSEPYLDKIRWDYEHVPQPSEDCHPDEFREFMIERDRLRQLYVLNGGNPANLSPINPYEAGARDNAGSVPAAKPNEAEGDGGTTLPLNAVPLIPPLSRLASGERFLSPDALDTLGEYLRLELRIADDEPKTKEGK